MQLESNQVIGLKKHLFKEFIVIGRIQWYIVSWSSLQIILYDIQYVCVQKNWQ